jgi:hypothetical protein
LPGLRQRHHVGAHVVQRAQRWVIIGRDWSYERRTRHRATPHFASGRASLPQLDHAVGVEHHRHRPCCALW